MLYTISGAIFGGLFTYLLCKIFKIETAERASPIVRLPSTGQILVCIGVIFGAGIGFGVGANKMANRLYKY